ncbi:MAG: hypothetical protein NTU53_00985 [Planctomycetota bacterium]|nr:hypothetical protein [Planctomycetota bacterium]
MDPAIRELMDLVPGKSGEREPPDEFEIAIVDTVRGEIEIELPGGPKRYLLKPLAELFGPDRAPPGEGWDDDERILVLLLQIEESIKQFFCDEDPALTDSHTALVLSNLAMKPGRDPGDDPLCRLVQARLRLMLSLNDYSRQEVRWALNKIERSVQLHRSLDGPRRVGALHPR